MKTIALYLMVLLYFAAGVNHFRDPGFYRPIMPPYIPEHELMIALSGAAEILLAIMLLFRRTRRVAAWSIIFMLMVFMTVHIYMFQERHTTFSHVPEWLIIARLPLQFVFIYWAYIFTKKTK